MKTRQVEDVVHSCEQYWKRTGVPREAIRDMKLELETHLRDALEDGRSLESVVGDEMAFAETWAREFRAPWRLLDRRSRVAPALAGLAAGLLDGLLAFSIAMPVSSQSCCPTRVTVLQPGADEYIFFWVTVAVSLLALAGAVSMITGRARVAAFLWGTAVVPAFVSAGTWFVSILLLLATIGARRHFRQAGLPSPELSIE
jgi:hypothetical protein